MSHRNTDSDLEARIAAAVARTLEEERRGNRSVDRELPQGARSLPTAQSRGGGYFPGQQGTVVAPGNRPPSGEWPPRRGGSGDDGGWGYFPGQQGVA